MENEIIAFKTGRSRYNTFRIGEIIYFEADNSYTVIKMADGKNVTLSCPLYIIAEHTKLTSFIYINRSILLNPIHICCFQSGKTPFLNISTGESLKPSKTGIIEIKKVLTHIL
jgi:DNA-binding LytR/AlgR family response regulator